MKLLNHLGLVCIGAILTACGTNALPTPSAQNVTLLPVLSSGLEPLRALVKRSVEEDDEDSDVHCQGYSNKYIYFIEPSAPNTTLSVEAEFTLRYPAQLRHALKAEGFELAKPKGAHCGWTVADEVSKLSVVRGKIKFRPTAGLDAVKEEKPSEATVERVRKVLQNEYPAVEIGLIVGFFVGVPLFIFVISHCS